MNYKVGIVSLGCAKNQVDAEMLLYTLKNRGFIIVNDPADADAVIVNTCGFIESAKQESINEIIELGKLKDEGKIKAIIVTGCLAQRYKSEISEQLYEVDSVIGIGANETIADIVLETLNGQKCESFPDKVCLPLEGGRILSTPPYTAYLKIAEGCDNRCSYCLRRLCRIDGFKWIRVLYCYPDRITDELIDTIASEDKIVKYMDIPLQHCNKDILRRMNRHGDRESLTALMNKIKDKIPNVIFRSTFITGFPGETEEQFNELAEFAADMKFQRLGCFAYSPEEDTKAAEMPDQIDEEIKQKRADIIMEHQQQVMAEYCESLVGKEIEVLVEGFDKLAECFFGRSYADAPEVDGCVFFTCDGEKPKAGDFVKVRITDYTGCDPVGEFVGKID